MEHRVYKNLEYFDKVYNSYLNEFPIEERKDKTKLIEMFNNGYSYDLFFDNDELIAYMFLLKNDEYKLIFIDYFAVIGEYKNKGYGSEVLRTLKKLYPSYALILEIEKPDGNYNSITERRKRFYFKNGAKKIDIDYKFPTPISYIDMDLLIFENKQFNYNKDDLYNFLKNSIIFIHSDYTHTLDVINTYINKLPKTI